MKKILTISAILIALALVLFQDREKTQSREVAPKVLARAMVEVSKAQRGPVYKGYSAVGTIAPEDMARIMPKVTGRISALKVAEGDRVEKGDLLLSLDAFDYIRALENVTSATNQAKVTLEKAKRDFARVDRLFRDKTISAQNFHDTKTQYEFAQYAYDQVLVAKKTAERNLRECRITAPISGIITGKHVNEGELAGPQTVAFVIMQMDPVKVEVNVPENAYGFMEPGDTCHITVDAVPGDTFEGKITKIYPTIDPARRTVQVTASLANPELMLRSGMTARVKVIQKARRSALVVPKSALLSEKESPFVYKVTDDMVEKSPVTVGIEGDNAFEIKGGLAIGDLVVTKGLIGLRDGMAVAVASQDPAGPNPQPSSEL